MLLPLTFIHSFDHCFLNYLFIWPHQVPAASFLAVQTSSCGTWASSLYGTWNLSSILLLLFNHQVVSNSLWPHELQFTRPLCPSPYPGVCPSSCPLNLWCHPTIWSSVTIFFCLWQANILQDIFSRQEYWRGWKWKSPSLVPLFATMLLHPWDFPGMSTGVGCHFLLQWTVQSMQFSRAEYWSGYLLPSPDTLPKPGSNPGLPDFRQILYQLSHKGSPRILEWVAYPSSSGSSQTRNRTGVSCMAGRFFTNWAIREAHWSG